MFGVSFLSIRHFCGVSVGAKGSQLICFPCLFLTVMENLTSDKQGNDPEIIREFACSINSPTLVLWGANDKVEFKNMATLIFLCMCV